MRISNSKIETAVREQLQKPSGELTKADLEKVTELDLGSIGLTNVKGSGEAHAVNESEPQR